MSGAGNYPVRWWVASVKYVYVLGLEHSGTTLVSSLAAAGDDAVALGEVSHFLSPDTLRAYRQRWGDQGEAIKCSCGETWWTCDFWSPIEAAWDLQRGLSRLERYRIYFRHLGDRYGEDVTVIDSSKSLEDLQFIVDNAAQFNLAVSDISVLMVVKDPRSFAFSIKRKNAGKLSVPGILRTFNWWYSVNARNLAFLQDAGLSWRCIQYEKLCLNQREEQEKLIPRSAVAGAAAKPLRNHIVLSNKDFLQGKNKGIRYDYSWFGDRAIQLAYLMYPKIGRLNEKLYRQ